MLRITIFIRPVTAHIIVGTILYHIFIQNPSSTNRYHHRLMKRLLSSVYIWIHILFNFTNYIIVISLCTREHYKLKCVNVYISLITRRYIGRLLVSYFHIILQADSASRCPRQFILYYYRYSLNSVKKTKYSKM